MVEVGTISVVALQNRLNNGSWEAAKSSKRMENLEPPHSTRQQEDHAKEMHREIQRLREENTSLRLQNQVLEKEAKGNGDEVSALQKELARAQLDAAVKIGAVEQHAANLQSELNLVKSQRFQVEERVLTMTRNLTKGKSAVEKLTGKLMSKISAQERMIERQRDRFDTAALSCRIARDEIERTKGKDSLPKEEEERIRELEAVVEEQKANIEALDKRNREVSRKCEQLEAQKSDANRVAVKFQAQVKKSEIHQILMKHKLKVSESVHAEMEEIHKSKARGLELRCMKLEARCEALHRDVGRKEGELQQMNRVVEAAFAGLGEEISKLESAFEEQLEHLHSRISECSRGHQILRVILEAMISRKNGLELENRELMKGMMSLNEGFKQLESSCLEQIENLHSKISKCSEGNQVLKEGLEKVAYEKSDLEVRNHEMMVRVLSLNQGVDMLEMGFREQIEQLESHLATCDDDNQMLQNGLEVLQSKKKVLELENHELKARIQYLNEGLRKQGEAFDEQIEYLDAEVTRCYEEKQIIKEGLQEVTSSKRELEHENRELVRGLMANDEHLTRVELVFEERMKFANHRILKFSEGYLLLKEWVEAIASKKKELELENRVLMAKVVRNEKDTVVLKEEIASVGARLEEKERERKRVAEIACEHEKRMHELEEKATKEKEEWQGRIVELEMAIKAMEEDAKHKNEEKRQAIMQLCMQIEYHRDKYSNIARPRTTNVR